MLEFYLTDDLTPLDDAEITNLQAGAESDLLAVHLWNSKGEPAGEDLRDLLLVLYIEDPQALGTWRRSGLPPLDELWARVRVVGHDNAADPTQEPFITDWRSLGAGRVLALPSLHAGCARHLELALRPPSTATAALWRWRFAVLHAEHAVAAPLLEGERGILTGIGDPGRSGLVRGGEVAVSDPPDDRLRIAAWQAVFRGRLVGQVGSEVVLDQIDGAGEALAAGESYWALLAASPAGAVVYRGARGVEPERPALPLGELVLKWVRVGHEPGGISVIDAADLDGETLYDRHRILPGTGLEVRVHPGEALAHGTRRIWSSVATVPVPAGATSYLWQLGDGRWEITETEEPPADTALGPLAEIEADAAAVTAIVDRRHYAGRVRHLTLRGAPGPSPGVLGELLVVDRELHLERVVCRASDAGAGSGQTVIEIEVGGATISPSSATDDQRPRLAAGAGELVFEGGIHEIAVLREGDVITARTAEHPDGGPPAEIEVVLICQEP